MKLRIGDIVMAISGREKGEFFIVKSLDNNSVLLVNGKTRTLSNPKTKNVKHIKFCKNSNLDFKFAHDCDIIFTINEFKHGLIKKVEELKRG